MSLLRRCSRIACSAPAVATLTYAYAESTAVVGPLASYAEPHGYDLCEPHADTLTAPRGWEVVRQQFAAAALARSNDDLVALAEAVREAPRPPRANRSIARTGDGQLARSATKPGTAEDISRRAHLRVLPSP